MNPTNPGERRSLFSSSRKTETSCWQAGYPDGPSSRAEIISRTGTTVKVGISGYPWSSGRIVALCIKVRDLHHRRQASPERSPSGPPKKKQKKTLQMAVFNHTLPQCSCFTESCKFNEGEQRGQILAGYPHPKKRRENAKQNGYLTRCFPSSQMKNNFDCTNAWRKVFSIANFLLDLGSSPFFLHCNSHWSASQAPASRHKLVTPGTKRRRHREKGVRGGRSQVQARAKKTRPTFWEPPFLPNSAQQQLRHNNNNNKTKKKAANAKTSWHFLTLLQRSIQKRWQRRPAGTDTPHRKHPSPGILSYASFLPLARLQQQHW